MINNNSSSNSSSTSDSISTTKTPNSMMPQTTLPPLSQVMFDTNNHANQQQKMMQQQYLMPTNIALPDPTGFAGFPTALPAANGKPVIPEHDEKCPFRTNGQPRIPRPRNAFILFRQHHHQAVLDEGNVIKTNPDVSRELGKRWRALDPEEKAYWNKLAEDEKKKHSEKYPGYRYIPRRAGKKGNCPACKAKAASKNGGNAAAVAASVASVNNAAVINNPLIGNILATGDGMSIPDTAFITTTDPSGNTFSQYHTAQFPHQDIFPNQITPPMSNRVILNNVIGNQFMPNQMLQQSMPQQPIPQQPIPQQPMAQQPLPQQQPQFAQPLGVMTQQNPQTQQFGNSSRLPPPPPNAVNGSLPPLQNNFLPRSFGDNYDPNQNVANGMNYGSGPVGDVTGQNGFRMNGNANGFGTANVSLPHINHLDLPTNSR